MALSAQEFNDFTHTSPRPSVTSLVGYGTSDTRSVLIPRGSRLPNFRDGRFMIGGQNYTFVGELFEPTPNSFEADIESLCSSSIGLPYRWGGRSPWGVDCSGFAQIVMGMVGVSLRRDTKDQILQGKAVESIDSAMVGDLLFARNVERGELHVGMMLKGLSVVHASGTVRRDTVTPEGIVDSERQSLTYRFETIRRVRGVSE